MYPRGSANGSKAIASLIPGPYHTMAQGKIESYHCSMKKDPVEYLPDQLEEFVGYHNNRRCHESLEPHR